MFVEMSCPCEASFAIDSEDEEPTWFMAYRFANQHVQCGFVTAATTSDYEGSRMLKKRIIKARREDEEEET